MTQDLGNEKVGLLIKRFYWPAFVSVIINALYNIVDRIFIGQGVGSAALAGLSIVFPIMLIIMAFGMLFGIGTGVQVSISMGQGNQERAERILGNGFSMMLLVSVFLTFLVFFIKDPLLKIFGATSETLAYANDYLMVLIPGIIFQVVGFSLNNVIRAEGNAKVAMYSMLIGAGTNLVLDPIFIFTFKMGVKGAALATVISMMVMCLWVLLHFFSKRSEVSFFVRNMRLERKILLSILAIGMAPFSMQMASSVVQGILNTQLVTYGGDIAVAANGIIMGVMQMIIMSIVAVNMATQPIIGFNYGAKNFGRVRETLIHGIWFASAISIGGFLLIELVPGVLVKLFNHNDPELYRIGVRGLRLGMMATFLIGFQIVVGNYFQSTGKAKLAMFISLLRQVIVLVPTLLILPPLLGLDGIWFSLPVADVISILIVLYFFNKEKRRLDELIASREVLL